MAAWTITTNSTASGLPFINGDSIASVASAAKFTWDIVNADLAIHANGMTCNYGIIEQSAGTTIHVADTYAITINEGGQWRSLGTSGSRCAITGSSTTTAAHIISIYMGGKFYTNYADISAFYYGVSCFRAAIVDMYNSTITGVGRYAFFAYANNINLINCTIATAANYYCVWGNFGVYLNAINTAFTSVTNNYLITSDYSMRVSLAGCTYQGIAINADDFGITTQDIDIRIYEASAVSEGTPLAGVGVSITHPSMDTLGMAYDATNYLKIPMALSFPVTDAAGLSTLYLLQKNAYWPSGLAVISRAWKSWSDSAVAEAGDNQKYTITMAKVGYVSATDVDWAGNAMTGLVNAVSSGGAQGRMVSGMV
jgi:hypothetical protein